MVVSRVWALALGLLMVGCASSENTDGGQIGEPCSDSDDCQSGLCIFTGEGGLCTGPCGAGCPVDWGCFGVRDIAEPGTVTEVCVPESPQLCTRCERDTDCAVTGGDLCLTDDLGRSFCGRDCSAVDCPNGFACEEVVRGSSRSMQCVPISGACDCGDAEANSTETCDISTFNGDCPGVRTCQGGVGWSDCAAASLLDTPDLAFVDDNCDGVDGTLDNAILVSKQGEDAPTCGLALDSPCNTINFAIEQAMSSGRGHVFVQRGLYNEAVRLADGVSVWGGYDASWRRGPHSDGDHRVEILGAADSVSGELVAIIGQDINAETIVGDVVITGATATGQVGSSGRSSYAIYARNSTALKLERISITAGDGADGSTGTTGLSAPTVSRLSAMNGRNGGPSNEFSTACNDSSRGARGSPKGDNTCAGGRDPDGGVGGRGGTMDNNCPFGFTATSGEAGSAADLTIGTSGDGGHGGSGGGSCGFPGDGHDGFFGNGTAGIGANSGGDLIGRFWRTNGGTSGGTGQNGTGGGGGGGSGGCDIGIDSYGAGGGSGGAGGCAARGGGGGGHGGGASFGILAIDSEIEVEGCDLVRGNGGDGGAGGTGGRGQSGGLGGNGGLSTNDSKPGGDGGDGAHGGHGGGGGGGAGGPSAAIARHNSLVFHDCSVSGGAAGSGGNGGLSAPTAPISDRDGRNGTGGDDGQLLGELVIP
jgi:hypothetical protein